MNLFPRLTVVMLVSLLTVTLAEEADDVPVVTTSTGQVSGIKEESVGGKHFFSYHSIPFAEPPLGDLRFKNPVAVKSWEGVKDGSKMPPLCPQVALAAIVTGMDATIEGEEDCLYLNVFTPEPNEKMPLLPVMVFIHGGAYISGGALEYPPHVLLNHDIVLVVIQYRLGVLGLKDQMVALKWVQNNIHNFGGDALKVTLFGESAGASSIHFHILSHQTVGLFQQAILQSGTAQCPWAMGAAHAAVTEYIGDFFNCSTEGESEELVTCLQGVEVNDLVPLLFHFSQWHLSPLLLGPRVDGDFLMKDPDTLMKEARHKRINLISGITQHEGAFLTLPIFANEYLRSSLKYNFMKNGPLSLELGEGDVAPMNQTVHIFDHYLGGVHLDVLTADNVTQMYSDRFFTICHDLTTVMHAKNVAARSKKTFTYELKYRGQRSIADLFSLNIGENWVTHTDELFYLFTGGPLWRPIDREEDLKLREIMTTLWTNFATTGNPTPDESLGFTWDPITEDTQRHLTLKPTPAMEDDDRQETREFWFALPLKQNLILHPEKVSNIVLVKTDEVEDEPTQSGEEPTQSGDEPTQTKDEPTQQDTEEKVEEIDQETELPNTKKDEL
ncbi:Venom carboxylesterase-6-like 10 [Homarus americanus]|uniref:Carboxylic ester hydrolase n=1 Tax=Homarus americanus TaxID=6706 RepID=A0A8J5K9V1_HOMAM|nr:Venom carboxylesterase-6-like 10 [Homarus americanus]